VEGLAEQEAVRETVDAIRKLCSKTGIPTLKEAGVDKELFDRIAGDALQEISTIFNPRDAKKEDVVGILEKAY
jgi:alcohol dehydrogenase class IV